MSRSVGFVVFAITHPNTQPPSDEELWKEWKNINPRYMRPEQLRVALRIKRAELAAEMDVKKAALAEVKKAQAYIDFTRSALTTNATRRTVDRLCTYLASGRLDQGRCGTPPARCRYRHEPRGVAPR